MMSQKWTKRIIGVMAVVLAMVIAGGVLLPIFTAGAATLSQAAIPATGDKMMIRMMSILVIALAVVVIGIIISVVKKRKQGEDQTK